MAQMKVSEIQNAVKANAVETLAKAFEENEAVQFGDYSFAIPVEVEGIERWAKVSIVCGQLKDTKTAPKFDPFAEAENWEMDKEIKRKEAESKAKAKADKLARKKSK